MTHTWLAGLVGAATRRGCAGVGDNSNRLISAISGMPTTERAVLQLSTLLSATLLLAGDRDTLLRGDGVLRRSKSKSRGVSSKNLDGVGEEWRPSSPETRYNVCGEDY